MTRGKHTRPSPGLQDLTGRRFGRLIVVRRVENTSTGKARWLCRCDCGGETAVITSSLLSGRTQSCRCMQRELSACRLRARQATHGLSKVPGYNTWAGMVHRCHNPTFRQFKDYGGRGIYVCQGWRESPAAFLADVGTPPAPGLSLDRPDNDRGYDCGHCEDCKARGASPNWRWATRRQQRDNARGVRRLTYAGRTMSVADWARERGISFNTLIKRIYHGWSVEKALLTPARPC